MTPTPGFQKWFGASTVVDANGSPLVVYHGSTSEGVPHARDKGIWFAESKSVASIYACERGAHLRTSSRDASENVVPAYLSMQNPLVVDANGARYDEIEIDNSNWTTDELIVEAQRLGHDGLIVRNVNDLAGVTDDDLDHEPGIVFAVFTAAQIKSALGNNGSFDADNTDIRFSLADQDEQRLEVTPCP